MENRGPVFEKSNSVENVYTPASDGAAAGAGAGRRLQGGGPGPGHRPEDGGQVVPERGAVPAGPNRAGAGAARGGGLGGGGVQRERNDGLEERLKEAEDRGEALGKGLAAVQGDVKALRDEQAQGFRQVEERLSQVEGQGEDLGPVADGPAGGPAKRRTAPWREYPDLVTREAVEGDEEVFGEAWPLISEWRELKDAHAVRGRGFEWLTDEERLLVMELTLLEEHDMTLPPEKQPLRDFARNGQINWRRTALSDTRRALRKWELLLRVGRFVTFGLWRR